GWATVLHVVELTFLSEIFAARPFVASLALQNATFIADAFWWGALEGLRRGRPRRRAAGNHPLHGRGLRGRAARVPGSAGAHGLALARGDGADDAGRVRLRLPAAAGARPGAARLLLGRLRLWPGAPPGMVGGGR